MRIWARHKLPMPRERPEVNRMSIADELRKLDYKLEYEYGPDEDRIEVWSNEEAGMAVRIEWMTAPRPRWLPH